MATRDTIYNEDQVIKAIKGTGGIKTKIAERLKISRWTVDNYISRWPAVQAAYEEECERITDLAETKLIELIEAADWNAIKFYLQTKGKERGYVERSEVKIEIWRAEVIQLIQSGLAQYEDVVQEFDERTAKELFAAANVIPANVDTR